jgi:hypothetical protein
MYIIRQEIMMSKSPFKTVIGVLSINAVLRLASPTQTVNVAEIKSNTI